jgi:ATP-dependent Lon protease
LCINTLALESFESYIKLNKKIPEEVLGILKEVSDVERFSDIIIANLSLKTAEKQELLGGINAQTRLDKILSVIQGEIDVLGTERKIQSRVRKQMESNPFNLGTLHSLNQHLDSAIR